MNLKAIKPLKVPVALSLDESVVKRLRILAEEDHRTLSSCINLILRSFLRGREAKNAAAGPSIKNTPDREKPAKVKINVSLDGPTVEKLRALADEDDRRLSSYINLVLRDYLHSLEAEKKDG